MDALVEAVLEKAGIAIDDSKSIAELFENWLGLNDKYDGLTVEECAPLAPEVYDSLVSLLHYAMSPNAKSSAKPQFVQNILLESNLSPDEMTLDVFDAVRVTRWLHSMLDLTVDRDSSFLERLMAEPRRASRTVSSLYHHIQDVPRLQSQLHRYTQSLQQQSLSSSSSDNKSLQDPTRRLQQHAKAQNVANRLQSQWNAHMDRVEVLITEIYRVGNTTVRTQCRRSLGQTWVQYLVDQPTAGLRHENTRAAGMAITLRLLHKILLGVTVVQESHRSLLFQSLIPLHKPDALVLWRDQTSVLELYHEPLTQCIAVLIQKDPSLLPSVIEAMVQSDIFPAMGNTSKQVLLLHEIDTYLGLMTGDVGDRDPSGGMPLWVKALFTVVARCISSDHSSVAERALEFFKDKTFVKLMTVHLQGSLRILLPALIKREPSWNPTVRKMTYHVLKQIQDIDPSLFETMANELFSHFGTTTIAAAHDEAVPRPHTGSISTSVTPEIVPRDLTLKSGMGSWKPPATTNRLAPGSMPPPFSAHQQPPSTITGVAPWAAGAVPPVTVTGVAPWAVQANRASSGRGGIVAPVLPEMHKRRVLEAPLGVKSEAEQESNGDSGAMTGFQYVKTFMEKLRPPEEEDGASSWSKAQMAETPTLLPDLKFHDLVFGHDLGSGAFGSVRYARLIDKAKTRSQWPEYAVKVISTEKIREMGYEASVQREIAVLHILSHPGIARLVSSFRFKDGAYLVLEYASGGDLHLLLRKHGSLDNASTRFVIGEVVAALAYIHESGLVYSDLKAENVLITEPGHVKLTDFGGCRPVTPTARQRVKGIAKDLLKNLRDGDWRHQKHRLDESNQIEDEGDTEEEDSRIEGTTSYLPPEVVMGEIPTYAADAWALGCVTYQCLSGRPPFLEADDAATRQRIVSFDGREVAGNQLDRLFQDKHTSGIDTSARELIKSLLQRDPSQRPGMQEIAQEAFFVENGVDVFSLHQKTAYPLDVGAVAPSPDAQWSRRQFSSIWAPQPVAYDISLNDSVEDVRGAGVSSGPIEEGGEALAMFSSPTIARVPQKLGQISERKT